MDTSDPQAEFARLQEELGTRQSTTLFARSAIALMVALILGGTAGKLFWDALRTPVFGYVVSAVALVLAAYALTRYLRGRVILKSELERFERMMGLRRTLGLDDPSTLLPLK